MKESTMPAPMNIETVRALATKYRNWGRWGATDELGTVNFITPEKIAAAAKLVRRGTVISLAIPFDANGPQSGFAGRVNPIHCMLQDGGDIVTGAQDFIPGLRYCDDTITMPLQCATQWDALSHIYFDGKMYNDRGPEEVTSSGARSNAITALKDKIVSRGILLDIPRLKNKPWLEPGEAIHPADLDAAAAMAKVEIESGDIAIIRTGQMKQVRDRGSWGDYAGGPAPGLSLLCAEWLATHEIAGYATDTWGTEVIPNETADVFQPLHCVAIVNMGMLVGEIFTLEALAEDCAADGVYEFLFVAPPLPITGAVGSPINPQAIK
jgi:kynurenine formamidase